MVQTTHVHDAALFKCLVQIRQLVFDVDLYPVMIGSNGTFTCVGFHEQIVHQVSERFETLGEISVRHDDLSNAEVVAFH